VEEETSSAGYDQGPGAGGTSCLYAMTAKRSAQCDDTRTKRFAVQRKQRLSGPFLMAEQEFKEAGFAAA
jgi:hypothetical protein